MLIIKFLAVLFITLTLAAAVHIIVNQPITEIMEVLSAAGTARSQS
jgi:hypothetical protein